MSTRDWLLDDSPTSRLQANTGRLYRVFTALLRNPLTVLGALIILVLILTALLAPWIAPYSPTRQNLGERLLAPSAGHWMGTDELGRDVLTYRSRMDATRHDALQGMADLDQEAGIFDDHAALDRP